MSFLGFSAFSSTELKMLLALIVQKGTVGSHEVQSIPCPFTKEMENFPIY